MTGKQGPPTSPMDPVDYDALVEAFNQALIHTLRKHNVAQSFLDLWVPDADPVLGIASMVDSARIGGLAEITIRFSTATVPTERLPELERSLAHSCRIALERQGAHTLLRATEMKPNAADDGARPSGHATPTYWQPEGAAAALPPPAAAQNWDRTELPEFADVHPHFRPALKAASEEMGYESSTLSDTGDLVLVSGQDGLVILMLAVDPQTHVVRRARHAGAAQPAARAILDLFCKAAENLPIQEVADHIGLKVLDSLVDDDRAPPVGGVLLPANAGAPFLVPPRLARQAYNAYRARTGTKEETNFYYEPPSTAWQALSAEQRLEKADYALRGFLQSEGLYPDDLSILRIEKNKYGFPVRVIVGFSERIPVIDKPGLMRRLELRLRRDAESKIDLVADRAKDTSPLRRLS